MKIIDIALNHGFKNVKSFENVFKKNIIQHQQNIEKLIIDYKLLKKAMNFLYKENNKSRRNQYGMVEKSVVYQIYVKKLSR